MRRLFELIAKYNTAILFVVLEFFCIWLIVNFNQGQRSTFEYTSSVISGKTFEKKKHLIDYIGLREENDSLLHQNAKLKTILARRYFNIRQQDSVIKDSVQTYIFRDARVISNSVNQRNNYFIIDKGIDQGISPGMGVLCDDGIAGFVKSCSADYSVVMSSLHSQSMVSAEIRRNSFFGTLVWNGNNTRYMQLTSVPKHADVQLGDTIQSKGSHVFPPDIMLGIVEDFNIERGSNYYDIQVELKTNFSTLDRVYVIDVPDRTQLDSLVRYIEDNE